jgi:glycolate oxidase iron-sulfur subunit
VWLARALESTLASRIWRRLPRALRILVESAAIAPRASAPVSFTPAAGQRRGALALFRGCAAAVFDADTHHSAAEVLSQLGFDVYAPRESQCCGALARHAGAADEAERIAHATGESLGTLPAETVIGTASGCQRDLEQRVLGAAELSARSLFGFLAADSSFATKAWRIRPRHAAVLTPCTERPEEMKALAQVLERIAGLKLSWLTLQPRCCGAAGSYFVEQPDLAEALRAERVAEIKALAPDLLLTTNVGCRMYLAAGLRQAGMVIPVHHPVALLAEALEQTQ